MLEAPEGCQAMWWDFISYSAANSLWDCVALPMREIWLSEGFVNVLYIIMSLHFDFV